jgi:hypothetical protein
MAFYELHIRRGKLINDDPQKRCYDGAYYKSHIEWSPWEKWITGWTFTDKEAAETAAKLFCREDQQIKAVETTKNEILYF